MKFNITMFKEEFDENGFLLDKDKKTVEVIADTCCDAVIKATKSNRDWTVVDWECLDKDKPKGFVPETEYEKEAWAKVLKMREDAKKKAEEEKQNSDEADNEED